ncbi:hypothetical protein A2645_00940 [Candidatus Nomurabacteria bacterium RIFCSPHIGHO2_01_FULL_39_9]|uniref:RCK N-terminal domain-containing protein n=1 Tax=Candidatus Nomurabacteria bacterium RIFCSPHIGHO2_01_FULL_39_9 TaxID=1801735 RepID=A0A1F6UWV4_9BACT|nr:MAG: hypothetical protein A2645_00940 [Candidatus Nomurabacteria bacterium RIFCSPHIGHO2_01_FULL_39_9]
MATGIFELGVVIILAAILGVVARQLRQPVILAYIVTGTLIGIFGFFDIGKQEIFQTFSELGIMFLLFLIGLEIDYASLRSVGKISLLIGLGQIVFTASIGFLLSLFFGFALIPALFIAVALTFSSTIIVVKILSEKKELSSLYGKISVGFLLVQDFVAIILLLVLASLGEAGGSISFSNVTGTVLTGIILFALMLWLGRKIIPFIFDKIARSKELIFLTSLAWCFLIAILTTKAGFSIEIGGFLAGLSLANSSGHFQISSNMRYLRDFFIVIFFVLLGSSLVFSDFTGLLWPIIAYSLFVLIGNPLIVMTIMGIIGYTKRTSFLAGVAVAQISEFSLILAALGFKLGHLSSKEVSLITAVGIVTITVSVYMMIYSKELFKFLSPYLEIFERKETKETELSGNVSRSIVVVGFHRTGQAIAKYLSKKDLLIVDFDPDMVSILEDKGFHHLFGDISDEEIFERINFENTKIIISTSPDFEDNMAVLERVRDLKKSGFNLKAVFTAQNEKDLELLYKKGADYVILPHASAGNYLGKLLENDLELNNLDQIKLYSTV